MKLRRSTPVWRWTQTTRRAAVAVLTVMVGFIGLALLQQSSASTSVVGAEAESGTLAGSASTVTDTAASGGSAVAFALNPVPPSRMVDVTNAAELQAALADAAPGDHISMADGTYSGQFVSAKSGTAANPIVLKGGRDAVINGGSMSSGYAFQLGAKNSTNEVSYWKLSGFTVTGGQKGIIFDNVQHSVIDGLYVHDTGQEGVHLRGHSSDNTISNNTITLTGRETQAYGEGLYIGSAISNWGAYSQGKPDRSDRNKVLNNTISKTGSENLDVKEGTKGGIISGNKFDGSDMCPRSEDCNFGDSMLDMKGNGYTISNNTASHMNATWSSGSAENDAFQVHAISGAESEGSGNDNVFSANIIDDVAGYGINVQSAATGVIVRCDNTATAAGKGLSNLACTP